jgi:hypothetical protein
MRKYFCFSLALKATILAQLGQLFLLIIVSFSHLNSSPSFACFYSKRITIVFIYFIGDFPIDINGINY